MPHSRPAGAGRRPALSPGIARCSTNDGNVGRYDAVWRASEPYMRARKNDIHIPLVVCLCAQAARAHPEADADIVLLAILLHDIGWWSIDMHDIIEKGFGPNMMQSDVRFLHEQEGVRLSREVLQRRAGREPVIEAVGEIIDGHDTRPHAAFAQRPAGARRRQALALHRHRRRGRLRLVQDDAACLCRPTGKAVPAWKPRPGREMAGSELARTRGELMLHLI